MKKKSGSKSVKFAMVPLLDDDYTGATKPSFQRLVWDRIVSKPLLFDLAAISTPPSAPEWVSKELQTTPKKMSKRRGRVTDPARDKRRGLIAQALAKGIRTEREIVAHVNKARPAYLPQTWLRKVGTWQEAYDNPALKPRVKTEISRLCKELRKVT